MYWASIVGQKQTLKLLQVRSRTVSELPQAPGEAQEAATLRCLSEMLQFRFPCCPVLPVPGLQAGWVGNALELTSQVFSGEIPPHMGTLLSYPESAGESKGDGLISVLFSCNTIQSLFFLMLFLTTGSTQTPPIPFPVYGAAEHTLSFQEGLFLCGT